MKSFSFVILLAMLLISCQPYVVQAGVVATEQVEPTREVVEDEREIERVVRDEVSSLQLVSSEEPLPMPADPLLVRIIDRNHPVDQVFMRNIEERLVNIDIYYKSIYHTPTPLLNNQLLVHEIAVADLCRMLNDAKKQGVDLGLRSAFRDFSVQELSLKNVGSDTSRVNPPMESQHHSLAFDFSTSSLNYALVKEFRDTPEGQFLQQRGWEYGFAESYVANHDGIIDEPWHWVYLSPELAKTYIEMKNAGLVNDPFEFQALYPQP